MVDNQFSQLIRRRKMKRVLWILVALAMISLVAAQCGQAPAAEKAVATEEAKASVSSEAKAPVSSEAKSEASKEAPASSAKKLKVFYSNQQVGHPFWNVVTQGVNDAAAHFGMEVTMAGPTGMDNAAQIQMIDAAIASGQYDAMIIPAIVPEMFQASIDKAVEAGITVVTFCTDAPKSKRSCYVGTSGFEAGKAGGKKLAELSGGKANINIISGQEAQPDLNERIDGFKDGIKEFPDMKVTSIDYSGEQGLSKTVSDLQARLASDKDVNAFFSSMAEGGTALATVYPDFKDRLQGTHSIVFDDLQQTLDAIKAGQVDATIVQSQYNWGYGSLYQIHRLLQKKLPCTGDVTDTGVVLVTKDNLATYADETKNPQKWLDFEAKE
jgi:ribose transport system substrate-binding protein